MRILKNSDNDVFTAKIITSIPDSFEDITEHVINPEKLDEVSIEHLNLQVIAAVEEVMAEPAFWSNGEETVYDSNDIPTVEDDEGNPILDPSYVKTEAVEYVAPEPQKYRLVKKNGTDQLIAEQKVEAAVRAAIAFGNELIVSFSKENVLLGTTQDGMTKPVRQAMSEITNALITGSLIDAIDEIDNFPEENKDDKYITDERLQSYKQKIVDYLA